jgi:hypothetical protein
MDSDKPIVLTLLVAVLVLFSLFLFLPPGTKVAPAPTHVALDQTPKPLTPPSTLPTTGSPLARELNAAGGSVQRDVEVLHGMVGQLLLAVKEPNRPPLGINEDFARALTGANKMHLAVVPPGHPAIVDGKIVDRWGSPYFFHPRAADAIDVRSAGPDRKLFTDDDISNDRKNVSENFQ